MFSSCAIVRMLLALSAQFAWNLAMSARRSTISGCLSNASSAFASSFFEQTARITPRRDRSRAYSCTAAKPSPSALPWPSTMPSSPSSPMTPPQIVLSRSSTRHLLERPCRAASSRAASSPYSGAAVGATSCLERCHSAVSCQAASPVWRAQSSTARMSTPAASAIGRSRSFSRATRRAREPGSRCSLPPISVGNTGSTACCRTTQRNAAAACRQHCSIRPAASSSTASACAASMPACSPAVRWCASNANSTASGAKRCSAEPASSSSCRYWP